MFLETPTCSLKN